MNEENKSPLRTRSQALALWLGIFLGFLTPGSFAFSQTAGVPSPTRLLASSENAPAAPISASLSSPLAESTLHYILSGGLDLVAAAPLETGTQSSQTGGQLPNETNSRLLIREAELNLRAAIDQTFEGHLNVSAHDDTGLFEIWLREAWVGSSTLIPHSQLRVGRFALGVGQLNQIHQHDWPFISAPKEHRVFFALDQSVDEGLEITTPLWGRSAPSEILLTAGVTNGYCYGHCIDSSGAKPRVPVHYLRPSLILAGENRLSGTEFALDYLGYTDADAQLSQLMGFDFVHKSLRLDQTGFVVQSEAYFRQLEPKDLHAVRQYGAYLFAAYTFTPEWTAGLRLDAFTEPTLLNDAGQKRANLDCAAVPLASYRFSPSSQLRASYTYLKETRSAQADFTEQRFEIQLLTQFGPENATEKLADFFHARP
jgi:hypothetical protein